MQNFIEQQKRKLKELIVDGSMSFDQFVDEFSEALKVHMIQEFESRLPEKEYMPSASDTEHLSNAEYIEKSGRVKGFNECRSIMIEEINKLKNE